MRNAALLGALQAINFLICALNMRAIAHARYGWIAATDAAICFVNFAIIQKVVAAAGIAELLSYTVGGTLGALAGVWLSRHWTQEKE